MISAPLTLQSCPVRGGGGPFFPTDVTAQNLERISSVTSHVFPISGLHPAEFFLPCINRSPCQLARVTHRLEESCLHRHPASRELFLRFVLFCSTLRVTIRTTSPPGAGRACRTSVSELIPLSLYSQASRNSLALPLILPLSAV